MNKIVLITGGSSGIGLELSKWFARDGSYRILWVSLPQDELEQAKRMLLEEFPNLQLGTLCLDLSLPESPTIVKEWLESNSLSSIDVLVNNAGFACYGCIQSIDKDKERRMIQLNVLGLWELTKLLLPDMIRRDSGTIINLSSSASLFATPKFSSYGATKAFVKHFSLSLAKELQQQNSNVRILVVCPAPVRDTKFAMTSGMENINAFTRGWATTTKQEVAKDIWNAYRRQSSSSPTTMLLTGWRFRLLWSVTRWIPNQITEFMVQQDLSEDSRYQKQQMKANDDKKKTMLHPFTDQHTTSSSTIGLHSKL